ncbi:DUF1307 domain-containing protein [Staphylococcus carnosus]|uniref:Lipoprotein n=2 Tax=Staphylococcus carnosus TaxID=1281 RepID=A0AAJ0NHC2_STACA|nr:DUF1307 domain-containing protein [Staphylococcus carnosus]ANZ32566.1 hypothetical protein BEK99_01330 [Staphylococcus carnosus]KKB25454.1 lipoprotein [Staphylococcus carnosus]KOR12977.1 hypothetical protein AMC75_06860 [Staphylococcus carnosus]POA01319.1 DUF1307 domain-containing protein [Staphylococcus carnosus]QQS84454.1 DUF1307 domain-containing protein [Staphylococcus carnosus]
MKRSILAIAMLIAGIFLLAACDKEQSKTYEGDLQGAEVITTLTYKGDKVIKQSSIMTIDYDTNGVSKSDAKKILNKQEKIFKGVEGVTYKKEIKKDKAIQKVDIDYETGNVKKMTKKLGITGPAKGEDYVNVKDVERAMKKAGFEEKKPLKDNE